MKKTNKSPLKFGKLSKREIDLAEYITYQSMYATLKSSKQHSRDPLAVFFTVISDPNFRSRMKRGIEKITEEIFKVNIKKTRKEAIDAIKMQKQAADMLMGVLKEFNKQRAEAKAAGPEIQ